MGGPFWAILSITIGWGVGAKEKASSRSCPLVRRPFEPTRTTDDCCERWKSYLSFAETSRQPKKFPGAFSARGFVHLIVPPRRELHTCFFRKRTENSYVHRLHTNVGVSQSLQPRKCTYMYTSYIHMYMCRPCPKLSAQKMPAMYICMYVLLCNLLIW